MKTKPRRREAGPSYRSSAKNSAPVNMHRYDDVPMTAEIGCLAEQLQVNRWLGRRWLE
jgi:hypothetical protein